MKLNRYTDFINENTHLDKELIKIGYDKEQLDEISKKVGSGELGHFLHSKGKSLTFGILDAIYKDAISLHQGHEMKKGYIKALVRIIPIALSPISAFISYIGMALGSTRAVNKVLQPILEDPGNSYPDFLKKIIINSMKVFEGDISGDDPIAMAFVVNDGLVEMIKEETLVEFATHQCKKMAKEDPDRRVPDFYVENELRSFLNIKFSLVPKLPLRKF